MKPLTLLCLPTLLAACQQVQPAPQASAPLVVQGKAVAQASCSACHSIERHGNSYSSAPSFPVIVNQEGVTAKTLSVWLKGAHNYPQEMDLYLQDAEVDALVAYMLTLKDPSFQRPAD